jgi:hypothetical protein
MEESNVSFSSSLPVVLYLYQPGQHPAEWREFDSGPGIFHIPAGSQVVVRIRTIGDKDLAILSREIATCPAVTFLNLSENRNISDKGMEVFATLSQLTGLNLSSCGITDLGMSFLRSLVNLEHLNLAFCNRISDAGLRHLHKLNKLTYLDLQGCVKTSQGGVSKLERKTLTINR